MRNHRTPTALTVAAAALSLGLTACSGSGNGTGTKDEGKGSATQPSAPQTHADGTGTAGASGSASGEAAARPAAENGKNSGSGTGGTRVGTGRSAAQAPACAAADVRVTAAKADETPTAHIVLAAKNTSGHACRLYQYPLIAFGDVHTAKDVPAVAKSNPGTPVVLQPGDPAYANVRVALGGAHEDTKVVGQFDVNLFAADGPAEGSVVVSAPAGGLAVDEAAAKTGYWTYELRNGADEF